ncbi:MAG TPA: glycosyltransferase, partial [Solirubrobacteraceae bacterium]
MPSICFVTDDFVGAVRNGGIGTHFLLMGRLLAGHGWDVHVMYCGPVEDEEALTAMRAQLAVDGVSFSRLEDFPPPVWHGIEHFGDGWSTLANSQRAFEALESLHATRRFDIIEFSDWRALGFRAVQAKRAGLAFADTRLAVKLHSTTQWQRRGNLENRQSPWELKVEYCERYAFEHADLQLSPSRYMLADTRGEGWAVRDDAVVAYPFPARRGAAAPPAAPIRELVFFGRLERRKGLDLFLDALDDIDDDLPVLFLGRDGFIEGRRASALIAERIGPRPHRIETELARDAAIAELLRGDRLAIIASRAESFGFTVAECIADEVPFLATRAGAIPEVLAHDAARERWLFDPDAGALAAAVRRRLAAPPDEEHALRAAAAAACDPDAWNRRVEETYRALAARPAGPRARPAGDAPATVSVCVTYHDHPQYLPTALASLAAQTRPADEVLVIDDGSVDDSWQLLVARAATDARLRLLRHPTSAGQSTSIWQAARF